MLTKELIGIIAGIITLLGYLPYVTSTIRGKTKPNRAAWWIWALGSAALAFSTYATGAKGTVWMLVAFVIGQGAIGALSLKYGEGRLGRLDKVCLSGAILAVIFWLVFNSPKIAVIMCVITNLIGVVPTVIKTWRDPASENRAAWLILFCGTGINVLAVQEWHFITALVPVYMFLACGSIALLTVRKT